MNYITYRGMWLKKMKRGDIFGYMNKNAGKKSPICIEFLWLFAII